MPTYTYKCSNTECESEYEVVHSMDDAIVECRDCGNNTLKKVPSKVNVKTKETWGTFEHLEAYGHACEETKQDMNEQKESLKKRTWNS